MKSNQQKIQCEFFLWTVFQRDFVYYADARAAGLGKHSLGTKDAGQAMVALKALDRKMAQQRGLIANVPIKEAGGISIKSGWQKFLENRGRAQILGGATGSTLKRYGAVRDSHLEFCRSRRIENWRQIDKSSVIQFGNHRAQTRADATVKLEVDLLVGVIGFLIEGKNLDATHGFTLNLVKPQGSDRYCFTREQIAAMVDHCRKTSELEWFVPVVIGLATTGLRSESFNRLRWSDFDFDADSIRIPDERASRKKQELGIVRTLKGKRDIALPLHPSFKRVLIELPRHHDGYLLHGPRGGRLHARNTLDVLQRQVIKPLVARFPTPHGEIGFQDGVIHSFRHFFASEAFRQGANEAQILAWLGNRDSKMIEIYRHLRPDDSKQKMNQIDFLGDGTGSSPQP